MRGQHGAHAGGALRRGVVTPRDQATPLRPSLSTQAQMLVRLM